MTHDTQAPLPGTMQWVPAEELAVSSARPKHIGERFAATRTPCSHDEAHLRRAAVLSAVKAKCSRDAEQVQRRRRERRARRRQMKERLEMRQQRTEIHRQLQLQERLEKLARELDKVDDAVAKRLTETATDRAAMSLQLSASLDAAKARRQEQIARKQRLCAEHWRYALHVRARAARRRVRRRSSSAAAANAAPAGKASVSLETTPEACRPAVSLARAAAASHIQRWFRGLRLQRAARLFGRSKLIAKGYKRLQTLEYDDMAALLRQRLVLKPAAILFGMLQRHLTPTPAPAHRLFLSSFMMVFHPTVVFSAQEEAEQRLQASATKMLIKFYAWASTARASQHARISVRSLAFSGFATAWHTFLDDFNAWKAKDLDRLVQGLAQHHRQLTTLRLSVAAKSGGADSPASQEWNPALDSQQDMIETKLHSLGARQVLRKLTLERRAAAEDSEAVQAEDRHRTVSLEPSDAQDSSFSSPEPHAVPRSVPSNATSYASTANSEHSSVNSSPEPQAEDQEEQQPDPSVLDGLFNAAIAHEIALDDDFRLEPPPAADPESMEARVRQQMQRAFFDTIRQEMEASPPSYARLLGLVAEVRDSLMAVTMPSQDALRLQISAYFDLDHMQQQLTAGAFDFDQQQRDIAAKLGQLCAAARDEQVAALAATQEPVAFYKACLDLSSAMRLDMANFYINTLRPKIRAQAVQVEKANFQRALDEGVLQLTNTTTWLEAAAETASSRKFGDVFSAAVLSLLDGPAAWPETVLLDEKRVSQLAREITVATITAAVHTVASGSVPAMRELKSFRQEIARVVPVVIGAEDEPNSRVGHVAAQTVAIINASLLAIGQEPLSKDRAAAVVGQLERLQDPAHPVMALLRRRVRENLLRVLRADDAGTKADHTLPRNSGLDTVADEICDAGRKLARLSAHNRAVHSDRYDTILTRLL